MTARLGTVGKIIGIALFMTSCKQTHFSGQSKAPPTDQQDRAESTQLESTIDFPACRDKLPTNTIDPC